MYTEAELRGEDVQAMLADLKGLVYLDEDGNPVEVDDLPDDEEDDPDE
jgi:hypothetical protein